MAMLAKDEEGDVQEQDEEEKENEKLHGNQFNLCNKRERKNDLKLP